MKDDAALLSERGQHRRAAELFERVAGLDPDPYWLLRAGDSWRRAGEIPLAIGRLETAARSWMARGLASKAIATCKLILQLAPEYTPAASLLAALTGQAAAHAAVAAAV